MYEPREDSFLLLKSVKQFSKGKVLEIGTGSGILAFEASKLADFVIGVDVDNESIKYCNNKYNINNLIFLQSDLFEIFKKKKNVLHQIFAKRKFVLKRFLLKNLIKNKFDTIIFNPPYLPNDKRIKDNTIYGGKKGYEVVERFLKDVRNYLNKGGIILLLFSSLTHKDKINEFIKNNKLKYKEIDKLKLDFEELYVYKIFC